MLHKQALADTHSSRIKLTALLSLNKRGSLCARTLMHVCAFVCVSGFDQVGAMRTLIFAVNSMKWREANYSEYHTLFLILLLNVCSDGFTQKGETLLDFRKVRVNGLLLGFRIKTVWNDLSWLYSLRHPSL